MLCHTSYEETLADIILRETTTFGLRRIKVEKTALDRETETVQTSIGEVRVKSALRGGKVIKAKPEYEDCRKIAEEKGIPLREVYTIIQKEIKS